MSFAILLDSSSPAIDSVRAALEAKEGFWFSCLLIASAGVAVGCVLEIPETWSDLKDWRSLQKDKTAPHPGWRVPMAAIGLLLVVVGVVGEGIFESLVSINETRLRSHDEQVLAETIIQAGEAKDSATGAAKAASGAQVYANDAKNASASAVSSSKNAVSLATGARREADSFAERIVSANKTATEAESHLADALHQAARAEGEALKAREELEVYTSPRVITPAQQADIATKLIPFGVLQVDVFIIGDSPEISNLTSMIISALGQAHWRPKYIGKAISGPNAAGVFIGTHTGSDTNTESAAVTLRSSLESLGIAAEQYPHFDNDLPFAMTGSWDAAHVAPLRIVVCSKPNPK